MREQWIADFPELQKIAFASARALLCNPALDSALRAQSSFLSAMESATKQWIHRRREALATTEHMLARIQNCEQPADIWKLQQEWLAQSFERFSADLAQYQSTMLSLASSAAPSPAPEEPHGQAEPNAASRSRKPAVAAA